MHICGILLGRKATNKPVSWSKFDKPDIDKVTKVAIKQAGGFQVPNSC